MEKNRIVTELFFEKPSFEEVSKAANLLGTAGVKSILMPPEDRGINTHLIVEKGDLEKAKEKLKGANMDFHEKDVIIIRLENKPGTMADAAIKISQKGINMTYAFSVAMDATHSYVLLGTSDNDAALLALEP